VLIESGIDLAIVGLIGLGIASIVRSSAASLSIFTSVMLVLTVVLFAMPGVIPRHESIPARQHQFHDFRLDDAEPVAGNATL